MTEEEIKKAAQENIEKIAKSAAEKTAEEKAKEAVEKSLEEKGFVTKEDAEKAAEEAVSKALEEKGLATKKEVDAVSASLKAFKQTSKIETVDGSNIETVIKEALSENAEALKNYSGGGMSLAVKAVTDASWASGALARQTTDVRTNLYMSPYSPFYLRNIFPNISTDAGTIVIPQMQAITGAAAAWARGTGSGGADVEKPEVTPTYKDVSVSLTWLAGFTTVNRELLMNVPYLQTSITNTLLYSRSGLFAAENKLISDYLSANAVAYAGTRTVGVERIKDAAFNQLLGNYFTPTHVLMNQADYLKFIDFNKASGSGEYDLPNGKLNIINGSGLEVSLTIIPIPTITAGTAYVLASNEFEFISRMQPELKVSEDHGTNFTYNKVTFRAEEMVAFIAKDLNAAVKINLATATNGDEVPAG